MYCIYTCVVKCSWAGFADLDLDFDDLGIPDSDDYVRLYESMSGVDAQDVIKLYTVHQMFRWGSMMQGVMKRFRAGRPAT